MAIKDFIYSWQMKALIIVSVATFFGLINLANSPNSHAIVDISWPNCKSLPLSSFRVAIIGVNGGLDYSTNPCLGSEARLSSHDLTYLNSGDPGFPRIYSLGQGPLRCKPANNLVCYSFNYGYRAALYSIKEADLAAVHSPFWWIDVESINSWTSSVAANRADISGMVAAIKATIPFSPKVGIYSATNQWISLVGHWRIGLPLWLGTGAVSRSSAASFCHQTSFTGAKIILTQYTIGPLDYNYSCS